MKNQISFTDIEPLLHIHYLCDQVPLLVGAPGIGKSSVIKNLANHYNTQVFILSVNQLGSREDLTGARPHLDEDTQTYRQIFFPHAIVQDAIDYALEHPDENPILFMDEINRTDPDVTSAIMAVITERRVGTTNLPSNIRLIAAGNDNGNVSALDSASITRMHIYHMAPDYPTFVSVHKSLNPYISKILQRNPDYILSLNDSEMIDDDEDDDTESSIEELFDTDTMRQMTVPRTISYLNDALNSIGLNGVSLPKDLAKYYDVTSPIQDSALSKLIYATIGFSPLADDLIEEIGMSISSLQTSNAGNVSNPALANLPTPNDELVDKVLSAQSKDEIDDILSLYSEDDIINSFIHLITQESYRTSAYPRTTIDFYDLFALTAMNFSKDQMNVINKAFAAAIQGGIIAQPILSHINTDSTPMSITFQTFIGAFSSTN